MRKSIIFVLGILIACCLVYASGFSDSTQSDFDNGTYANASYNGTGVVLSGANLTGTFTSRVFDAGSSAVWNNISVGKNGASAEYLYVVDIASDFWRSTNFGVNWSSVIADYNNGDVNGADSLRKNSTNSLYITNGQDVWVSNNAGVNWTKINDDFNGAETYNTAIFLIDRYNNLIIIDTNEQVWKSTNSGTIFTMVNGSFSGTTSNFAGIATNSSNSYFAVNAASDVFVSNSNGTIWTKINDDFNGGATNGANGMDINSTNSIFVLDGQDVWVSNNAGVNWTKINDDFNGAGDANNAATVFFDSTNKLYLIDSSEDVYMSSDSGATFTLIASNMNGINSNALGMTSLVLNSNVTYQIRNCSLASCSDGIFVGGDGTANSYYNGNGFASLNKTGRYFQYRTYISREDSALNPVLNNVTINYELSDSLPPTISIISPANTTYNSNSVFLNYSAADAGGIGACWYQIDSSPNITLLGCTTATLSGLTEGSHNLKVYANDTLGNTNYSQVIFAVDSIAPAWSSIQTATPGTYGMGVSYFNVTWTGSPTTVLFESNFSGTATNYTMYLISGNVYGFNSTLPAGGFYWKSHASDALGNANSTAIQEFTIAKAGNAIRLYLNGNENQNLSVSYGTTTNATAIADIGAATLTREGSGVGNPEIALLGAKELGYLYTASSSGNENYSSNSTSSYLIVNKLTPSLNLLIDGTAADKEIIYGATTNASAYEGNIGDGDAVYSLFRNGLVISNPDYTTLGAENYVYTYNTTGGENYSSNSASRILNVTKATPTINLYLNGAEANATQTYGNASNATAVLSNGLELTLLRNGVIISNGDIGIFSAGEYNYTALFEGNENYSAISKNYFLTITKAAPSLSLLINGAASDSSAAIGSIVEINSSLVSPSGTSADLYEDGLLVSSGSSLSVQRNYTSAGNKVWTLSFAESENYSGTNLSRTVNVLDSGVPQYSGIRTSLNSPASYTPANSYQFNATWTDNVGISDVILEFDGTNYSYSSGQVSKNGDEYYLSLGALAVGSYSFKWHANDTSNSRVSTTTQNYVIEKGITALFLTITPSNSASYGTTTSVSCSANNGESAPAITRNTASVSNPDSVVLAAGAYNYACTAGATQNYTSASTTGTLTVNKATPVINLTLNGVAGDVVLAAGGGEVNISAALVNPGSGSINLTRDGNYINYGASPLNNISSFSSSGSYTISATFYGSENFTSKTESRTVTVSQPSGGGGSGGGGGGGSYTPAAPAVNTTNSTTNIPVIEFVGTTKLELNQISDMIVNPGESKKMTLSVKNSGTNFLNECKLKGRGSYASWVTSNDVKNLAAGEKYDFIFEMNVLKEADTKVYNIEMAVECQEINKSTNFNAEIIRKKLAARVIDAKKINDNEIRLTYSLTELSGEGQNVRVEISLIGEDGEKIGEVSERRAVNANSEETFETVLAISSWEGGNINLLINANSDVASTFVQETLLLDSTDVGGFAIFYDSSKEGKVVGFVIILGFIVFVFIIGKRIVKYKKAEEKANVNSAIASHYGPINLTHHSHAHTARHK